MDTPQPKTFNGRSSWIWADLAAYEMGTWSGPTNTGDDPYLIAYFRRSFDAPAGAKLTVHVSADSRYILWCNGTRVGRGPGKGDVRHQFYDTHDVSHLLVEGENVLAAQVISYARVRPFPSQSGAPDSIMSEAWIFALEGDVLDQHGDTVAVVDTSSEWKAIPDAAYTHVHCEGWGTYLGMFEDVDGARYPWGWQERGFDDSAWRPAYEVFRTISDEESTGLDSYLPHTLTPRIIPQMEEIDRRFDGTARGEIRYASGITGDTLEHRAWTGAWGGLISNDLAITVKPNTRVCVTLWCDTLQTGFPVVRTRGGSGANIRLTYAEALTYGGAPDPERHWRVFQGRLDPKHAPEEGDVAGYWDTYRPGGGHAETYEPLHWRTFRYVRVEVETGAQPVTITHLSYRFCAYPYEENARYVSSDTTHERLWELSWRTARLCAHETYEDCPYYEQLQYSGDSQVQALIGYYVAGDPRLARQAIRHFDWSRGPEGLTQSRYPNRNPQYIPTWSLLWVAMIRDYYWHTGDTGEVSALAPGVTATLSWFARYENDHGLLEALPHWKVVDWVAGWNPSGYPPGADGGVSVLLNLQYVYALRCGAEVAEVAGDKWHANMWKRKANKIAGRLGGLWWESEGAFRDRPDGDELSELTQAWAILAGLPDEDQTEQMVKRLAGERRSNQRTLARATLYGRFYVFRALSAAGYYEQAYGLFDHWRTMMRTDLTTWPEEPYLGRSYCHAWSAAPIYELLAEILGVKPATPGWTAVTIRPTLWNLNWAEGSVPTPKGDIHVRWDIEGGMFHLVASGPKRVPIEVVMPDGTHTTVKSGNTVRLSCAVGPATRQRSTRTGIERRSRDG